MAERGTVWTPTLAPVHAQWAHAGECGWSPEVAAGLRRILDRHAEQILLGRRLGVRILAGSDAGAPGVEQGRGLVLELELLAAVGIPVLELLRGATRTAADLLGAEGLGRIAPGCPASFIAVDGRPDRAIGDLKNVLYSVRSGRFFHGAGDAGAENDSDAARKAG
jgi:imidazolonepropionase-like amidohydrolase